MTDLQTSRELAILENIDTVFQPTKELLHSVGHMIAWAEIASGPGRRAFGGLALGAWVGRHDARWPIRSISRRAPFGAPVPG